MEFLNKKQKLILIIIGSIMVIFIGYYILNKTENSNYIEFDEEELINTEEETIEKEENEIVVHITGEVENEGIIKIEENARLADVIEKAGGATNEADLSKINLAYAVKDGQKIYIPNIEEDLGEEYITNDAGEGVLPEEIENLKAEKVNINTAKQTELETLNGIGPSTALKIINYRNENGKFKKIEDIKNVPGIGESKFENIKEDICV
ncbi:MAG: helix-hairpin-helix domain-containing protein [Clostridia bacterium]|nr:helix-hairpin-helix domain-containing protein [Clostridia bacterium]